MKPPAGVYDNIIYIYIYIYIIRSIYSTLLEYAYYDRVLY